MPSVPFGSLPRSELLEDKHHGKTDINPFLCHVIRHKWRLPRYLDDWLVTWLVNPYETISDHLLYPTVCAVSCKIGRTETPGHLNKTTLAFFSEGETLGVRFFTAFCNHWHCTCAMVLSLLCNPWQFLLGFSAMAKQNQNPKKQQTKKTKKTKHQKPKKQTKKQQQKTKWQNPTLCHYSPLGGAFFFGFWFVVGFLKG